MRSTEIELESFVSSGLKKVIVPTPTRNVDKIREEICESKDILEKRLKPRSSFLRILMVREPTPEEIAEKTIVMTRNEQGLIPLDRNGDKDVLVICPASTYMSEPATGWTVIVGDTLGDEISNLYPGTVIKTYNPIPDQGEIQEAISAVDSADIVVIASFNAHYSTEQRDLIQGVLDKGKPTILVALGVPYDIYQEKDPSSTIGLTNFCSEYLITVIPLVIFGFFMDDFKGLKPVIAVLFIPVYFYFLITKARAAWLGFIFPELFH
jgi:hypothetical protein